MAQPHEHAHAKATRDARHALRATMVLNTETGGDLTALLRSKSTDRLYMEAHPQHGSGAELRTTAVNDRARE